MIKTISAKGDPVKLPDNPTNEQIRIAKGEHCPFCNKTIYPINVDDFMSGIDNGFIYVHDEGVIHDDDYNFEGMH